MADPKFEVLGWVARRLRTEAVLDAIRAAAPCRLEEGETESARERANPVVAPRPARIAVSS